MLSFASAGLNLTRHSYYLVSELSLCNAAKWKHWIIKMISIPIFKWTDTVTSTCRLDRTVCLPDYSLLKVDNYTVLLRHLYL